MVLRRVRTVLLACVITLVFPLLAGCWDRLEIEDRAVVLGVSIDTEPLSSAQEEDEVAHVSPPSQSMIRVAVQIAIPGRIPLGPGEGGGGSKQSGGSETVWVIDVVGHSIDDAFMNLQQQVSSRLFFGHLRVIVISEDVAKRGLDNINDYFRRNSEVRRMAWMMVSRGKAIDFMRAAPKLERVPTLYLMATVEEGLRLGKFPKDFIGIFWSNTSKKGQEGFLPYVQLKKEENVEIEGLAYFKGNKLVGTTNPLEIAAYMSIKGLNPAGYRIFVKLNGTEDTIVTSATHRESDISLRIVDGRPQFNVRIALELNIEEKLSENIKTNQQSIIRAIDRKQEELATEYYGKFIKKTQEDGSDIFGFGEYIRAMKPGFWNRQVKTKDKWQKMYQDCKFNVEVTMRIRRVGMKAQ